MKKLMNWLKNEESGQGMVEYALIIVAIAVVVIVALQAIGTNVNETFEEIGEAVKPTTP
jgi:pilus assembly protein Flp/PilA